MNNYKVDLTNCDKEPIHIPGKIQSHGFLIAINSGTFKVAYASENIKCYLGIEVTEVLELHLSQLKKRITAFKTEVDFMQLLKLGKNQHSFDIINPYKLRLNSQDFYLIIHQSGNNYVMEFEEMTLQYDIQNLIGRSVSEILSAKSLIALLEKAAAEVKNMIAYDRVMIYKFQEDAHGVVIAEAKNEELTPWFGLHYPASDIPKQARELYKLNYTRIIADVNSESSAIATYETNVPLNLTYSGLRAVSQIHIQYLKNMGVASSFSISLIAHGELWGLIVCHNYSPRFIDYRAREGAKLIGQILSSALEYRKEEKENEKDHLLKVAVREIETYLEKDADLISALTKHQYTIQQITHATGAAILFENQIYRSGETPNEQELAALFEWLKKNTSEAIYHTHQLPEIYSPSQKYPDLASGILVCMLSKDLGEMIVWFKPEQIETINWAGDPNKPVEIDAAGNTTFSPRHSFERCAQIVKNTSERWSQVELSGALMLREKMVSTINKKANEIRLLNERLRIAYEELDTFSYTISHDLRTPLTSIKSYTELFLLQNSELHERGKKLLDRVIAGADKMGFLINEILNLARIGRSEPEFVSIDMQKLLQEITLEVVSALKAAHVAVVLNDCPRLHGDHTLISQVFTNLIGNAVKYSTRSESPIVSITGVVTAEEVIYTIKDNGIGMDANFPNSVFELFKRKDNVSDYEGTGVGLAIVKRIIERYNGRIWYESELGLGTTFYVAFKTLS